MGNLRKVQVLYWSFKELGPQALSSEDGWFILAAIRSEEVQWLQPYSTPILFHSSPSISSPRGGVEKYWCWYVFGPSEVARLPGSMSELYKYALRLFLVGCDDIRRGVQIGAKVFGGDISLFIADAGAHKIVNASKGASGHKPCQCCRNVCAPWSRYLDSGHGLISTEVVDVKRYSLHTDKSLNSIFRKLAEAARWARDWEPWKNTLD